MQSRPHSIVIGDYHPLFRGHCSRLLQEQLPNFQVFEAGTVEDVIYAADRAIDTKLVLFGLSLPDTKNFSGLRKFKDRHPGSRIGVVSEKHCPDVIFDSFRNGASGYLPKSLDEDGFMSAVWTLVNGNSWVPTKGYLERHKAVPPAEKYSAILNQLTPQQRLVMKYLMRGHSNQQISDELGISHATAKCHVSAIIKRLGVCSRTQAVIAALQTTH